MKILKTKIDITTVVVPVVITWAKTINYIRLFDICRQ